MGGGGPPPPSSPLLPLAGALELQAVVLVVAVRMKAAGLVLLCSLAAESVHGAAANSGRCSNLTLVLDSWKYAIVTQVRDLLLRDHSAVLPGYARIQPLSDALRDLYKDFNGLKERLSQFTARFDRVERFVDGVRYGRNPPPLRGRPGEAEPPGRRTRVVVRRVKKPAGPEK